MKEIFSAFGAEVFRPLVTLALPGTVLLSTWFVALIQRSATIAKLVDHNHVEASVVLLIASLAAGMVLDDLGALIESSRFDKWLPREAGYEKHSEQWYSYLRFAFSVEPVGHRHLRGIVLHMKFELNTFVALVGAVPGVFLTSLQLWRAALCAGVMIGAAAYLGWEGRNSHRVASRVRQELLKGVVLAPAANDHRAKAASSAK